MRLSAGAEIGCLSALNYTLSYIYFPRNGLSCKHNLRLVIDIYCKWFLACIGPYVFWLLSLSMNTTSVVNSDNGYRAGVQTLSCLTY